MIETARLCLRPLIPEDAPFIIKLLNEDAFLRNIGDRNVRTTADAHAYIAASTLSLVELKDTHTPIGICGILMRASLDAPDIGFAFLRQFWSQGYAYESAAAVLHHGLNVLRIPRILAITAVDNQGSIRVLTKLGFSFEKNVTLPGYKTESKLFAIRSSQS
jgi:[ribosomal protein S5]-alanine N-acetyltransferase